MHPCQKNKKRRVESKSKGFIRVLLFSYAGEERELGKRSNWKELQEPPSSPRPASFYSTKKKSDLFQGIGKKSEEKQRGVSQNLDCLRWERKLGFRNSVDLYLAVTMS